MADYNEQENGEKAGQTNNEEEVRVDPEMDFSGSGSDSSDQDDEAHLTAYDPT